MRLARLLMAAVVLSAVFVWSTPTAGACSCVDSSEQERVDAADVVFEATLTASEAIDDDLVVWTFDVARVYKGDARQTELLYSPAAADPSDEDHCGSEFVAGTTYFVFADVIDGSETRPGYPIGDLEAATCGGHREAALGPLDAEPPLEAVAPIADAPTTTTTVLRPTSAAEEIAEPFTGGGVFVIGFIAVGIIGAFVASRIAKKSRES
ncbi:MAG: hypothetical protein R2707_17770 [Acidimicrobiales bacterium]